MAVKKAAREGLGTRLHVSHSGNFNNRDLNVNVFSKYFSHIHGLCNFGKIECLDIISECQVKFNSAQTFCQDMYFGNVIVSTVRCS